MVVIQNLGGDDYIPVDREVMLNFGNGRRCIGLIILDDLQTEMNETFQVFIEEFGTFTTVTIIDDDGKVNLLGAFKMFLIMLLSIIWSQ